MERGIQMTIIFFRIIGNLPESITDEAGEVSALSDVCVALYAQQMRSVKAVTNKIICGEALSVLRQLPNESIDAVITDPPYSSGGLFSSARTNPNTNAKYTNKDNKNGYPVFFGDNKDQLSFVAWLQLLLTETYRLLKDGSPLMVFTDWRQINATANAIQGAGFNWRGIITWNKGSGARLPNPKYFRHQCEYILWASKGNMNNFNTDRKTVDESIDRFAGCVFVPVIAQEKQHSTQKPVLLLEHLAEAVQPKGIILDPFIGSGTTALAALRGKRKFIGIELSQEYATIAEQRIKNEL